MFAFLQATKVWFANASDLGKWNLVIYPLMLQMIQHSLIPFPHTANKMYYDLVKSPGMEQGG